jgi:hypothetical protein
MSIEVSRRRVLKNGCLAGSLGLVSGVSGCSQIWREGDDELTAGDGVIIAERVESAPDSATVTEYNDPRILDHEEIQGPIKEAAESGSERLPLENRSVQTVRRILSELPKYSADQNSEFGSGYYFAYENEIIVLNLLILKTYSISR